MIDARCGSGPGFTGVIALVATLAAAPCPAIEMFTFFGDGSRIGLPSLEVPIEAYRGIPLRSDRLRARRESRQIPGGKPIPAASAATIRVVPETEEPFVTDHPFPGPQPRQPASAPEPPVAPEPPADRGGGPAAESIPAPTANAGPQR